MDVKLAWVLGGMSVWVSCWVVRSKTHRPRRERESVVKRVSVRRGKLVEDRLAGGVGREGDVER